MGKLLPDVNKPCPDKNEVMGYVSYLNHSARAHGGTNMWPDHATRIGALPRNALKDLSLRHWHVTYIYQNVSNVHARNTQTAWKVLPVT